MFCHGQLCCRLAAITNLHAMFMEKHKETNMGSCIKSLWKNLCMPFILQTSEGEMGRLVLLLIHQSRPVLMGGPESYSVHVLKTMPRRIFECSELSNFKATPPFPEISNVAQRPRCSRSVISSVSQNLPHANANRHTRVCFLCIYFVHVIYCPPFSRGLEAGSPGESRGNRQNAAFV